MNYRTTEQARANRQIVIRPWTPQWNAWLAFYQGTKNTDLMLGCIAAAATARALWLRDCLAEVLASDVAAEDVKIEERDNAHTAVLVRGSLQFEKSFAASWIAPAEWPPEAPRADRLTRPIAAASIDNGPRLLNLDCRSHDIDAVIDALTSRARDRWLVAANAMKANTRRQRETSQREAMLNHARDMINAGHEPQIDDDLIGTIAVVDPQDLKRRTKMTNLRDDPIGQMHRRGQLLSDDEKRKRVSPTVADVRLEAARRWQTLYELTEIGGAPGIDPSKDQVDGGKFVEPDTDRSGDARDELRALRKRLGMIELTPSQRITGERLLMWVLGDKKTLGEVAQIIGIDRRHLHLTRHLIQKLDVVGVHLRVSMRPNRPKLRPDDRYDDLSGRYLRSFQSFSTTES